MKEQTSSSDSEEEINDKNQENVNLMDLLRSFWLQYSTKSSKKIKLMDSYIVFCILLILI